MKKIVITGVGDTRNNGCWAMVHSAINGIKKVSPEPVLFYLLTRKNSEDKDRFQSDDVTLVIQPWTFINIPKVRFIWSLMCFAFMPVMAIMFKLIGKKRASEPFWNHLLSCDLVLDLSGDSLSADYNNFSLSVGVLPLLLARILKKPYMLCAQSIGPFKQLLIHKILISVLRDASVITTRERITDKVLSGLGIVDNVVSTQDLAFTLTPAPHERILQICEKEGIDPEKSWVGMSISGLISHYAFKQLAMHNQREAYVGAMADFTDFIVEHHNKNILFVPHVVIPNANSDLIVTSEVRKRMKHHDRALVVEGSYLGDELKGIIGLCDAFVGSRMHATIASLSQGIPTLTYAYNHKTLGINGQILKQNDYLLDIRKIDGDTLLNESKRIIGVLLDNKETIGRQLEHMRQKIVPISNQNAWIALGLLETAGPLNEMVDPLLCTGCGTCVAVCKTQAITMQKTAQGTLRPRFVSACKQCRKCHAVCPVLGFNLNFQEISFLGQKATDPEIGVVLSGYKGYSGDLFLRQKSSSGGLITTIAANLFQNKEIDAVLVAGDNPEDPFSPIPIWAENEEMLIAAMGSKYTPVSLNSAFAKIPAHVKNIAVVGLPCHLWGLRLLEKTSLLKGKTIKLRLGLFCGRTPVCTATDFIIRKLGIDKSSVRKIQYRGDGWPGGMRISTDKENHFVPLETFWRILGSPYYHSKHCLMCPDFFAHLSDVSFGDAWIDECKDDEKGWSVCFVRSEIGQECLERFEKEGSIHLEKIPTGTIKQAMMGNVVKKYRQKQLKDQLFSKKAITEGNEVQKVFSLKSKCELLLYFMLTGIGNSKVLEKHLLKFPPNLFMRIINKCQHILAK